MPTPTIWLQCYGYPNTSSIDIQELPGFLLNFLNTVDQPVAVGSRVVSGSTERCLLASESAYFRPLRTQRFPGISHTHTTAGMCLLVCAFLLPAHLPLPTPQLG